MAQIPQKELDELKDKISILELIRSRGIKLKPVGNDFQGLCPFHSEKTPSFTVTPDKGLYHCFGCERAGDVFSFIMESDGVDFPEAYRVLRIYEGGDQERETLTDIKHFVNDQIFFKQTLEHYRLRFRENPLAIKYLKDRGITRLETIEAFQTGYCDETLGHRLPVSTTKKGREMREHLKRLGLVDRKTNHERYSGCLVFPAFGESGEVLQLYGRLRTRQHKNRSKHLLLPSPIAGIFNRAVLTQEDVILCESVIDAMTFHEHGFMNVTAAPGAGNFTEELLSAFSHNGVKRVFIAFDSDEAGDRGADKAAERIASCGIEPLRVNFPRGMDANQYALSSSLPVQDLRVLLNSAERMLNNDSISLPVAPVEPVSPETPTVPEAAPEKEEPESGAESGAPSPLQELKKKANLKLEEKEGDVLEITIGDRFYRIFGLSKNHSLELLRINVRLYMQDGHFAESLDLASNKHQDRFANDASDALSLKEETVKRDLERMLLVLEDVQYDRLYGDKKDKDKKPELTEKERNEAMELLKSPDLMEKIRRDFQTCGVVGEEMNLTAGYLAATSRLLSKPIHVLIQSSSAAGKSTLMKAIINMMPPEEVLSYSALTGQALYYMQDKDLKHKILAIEEDEGAERAKYIMKMLQTEGKATIGTTIKDPGTGHMTTGDYSVEGPISTFGTSTAVWLDEEVQNRYLIMATDESREQTERILEMQRLMETLEGWELRDRREYVFKLHRNAQRLLRSFSVVNPYAKRLEFLNTRHRLRRDHEKYQSLIRAVTLLHQYQRPVRTRTMYGKKDEYIETTVRDIRIANNIANEVLGRSLDDMPPHTRNFLTVIHALANDAAKDKNLDRRDVRLTRKAMAERTGLSIPQVHRHLSKLSELEYVMSHSEKGGRLLLYEIVYRGEGEDGKPFLPGILKAEELEKKLEIEPQPVQIADEAAPAGGVA